MGGAWGSGKLGEERPNDGSKAHEMSYENLEIERIGQIGMLWLSRPEKLNAISSDMWSDIPEAVKQLDDDDDIRVIIVAGRGSSFSVGIDLEFLASTRPDGSSPAVGNMRTYELIKRLQSVVSSFAEATKPVIAAIHGYCLGAGVNLISACDIRLAAGDALFSIRETKLGLVADLGALQRLPGIIGMAATTEMALTGDDYPASWAIETGLVSRVFEDQTSLLDGAISLAEGISANSPLVTTGVKRALQANDGRTIEQSLEWAAQWNSAFLISNDMMEALTAFAEKRDPDFTGT